MFSFTACEDSDTTPYQNEEKLSYTEMLNGDGSIAKRWYYKYYIDGEISTSMKCAEDGTCIQRNEYTYNDKNLKDTEIIYLLGKKTSVTEFTYTEDDKIKTEKVYLPDGITETVYHYKDNGDEDFVEKFNASGEIVSVKYCVYDETGNKTKERFFDGNENYTGGIEYTYEGSLLITKEYVGNTSPEFSKEEYTYNGENVVKTILYDKNGTRAYTDNAEYSGEKCMHRMRVDSANNIVYTWDAYYDSFLSLIG